MHALKTGLKANKLICYFLDVSEKPLSLIRFENDSYTVEAAERKYTCATAKP